jgi:lathosterol oxidase
MNKVLQPLIFNLNYLEIYFLTFFYFLILYFFVGFIFFQSCKFLERKKIVEKIFVQKTSKDKTLFEVKNSLLSIFIFGFSGIFTIYFVRLDLIELQEVTLLNTFFGLLILILWNEIHFFVIHKILHIPYLYKTVHKIHHHSKIPSIYSVYSFHWIEALLLSTVPLTIAPFINFSPTAIFLFPLASILLNFSGHCNYRFGNGSGKSWKLFGTRHAQHHFKNSKNFGFVTHFFDRINALLKKSN